MSCIELAFSMIHVLETHLYAVKYLWCSVMKKGTISFLKTCLLLVNMWETKLKPSATNKGLTLQTVSDARSDISYDTDALNP